MNLDDLPHSSLLRIALLAGVLFFALMLAPQPERAGPTPLAGVPHAGLPARATVALSRPAEAPEAVVHPRHGG
jgi:hypothetical protein